MSPLALQSDDIYSEATDDISMSGTNMSMNDGYPSFGIGEGKFKSCIFPPLHLNRSFYQFIPLWGFLTSTIFQSNMLLKLYIKLYVIYGHRH